MTAEEFFPPYRLFEGTALQLSFPYDWRNMDEIKDHVNSVSQETRADIAAEAKGSRNKAMTMIEENRARRAKAMDDLAHEIEPILPKVRELLFTYYSAVRSHLEQSGKIEDVKSRLRAEAVRRRDHNAKTLVSSDVAERAYRDEIGRLEESSFVHFDILVRGLWTQICHGTEWDGDEGSTVVQSLDNLKQEYFVPDRVDSGLRVRLKPLHERLRTAQWALYRIHERGEMEAGYWSAYLQGMAVAPVEDRSNGHAKSGAPEWNPLDHGFTSSGWRHFKTAFKLVSDRECIPGKRGNENATAIFREVAKLNKVGADAVRKSAQAHGWHDPQHKRTVRDLIQEKAQSIPQAVRDAILRKKGPSK